VSGLELCPKCKKGHLYPVVTASASAGPKGQFKETGSIRDYECAICGYKQKAAKQTQNVDVKDKVSASVKKTKKPKPKPKPKTKPKTKRKRTKQK
jgi:Zn ribbon nucleic-acid-binding protein